MADGGFLVFVLSLLSSAVVPISSCGVSTHIDIAHQAIQWFKDVRNGLDYREIILKHQDAFIGGNPYPDALYSSLCFEGKFHSIAEDTHWAPFLNATVRYIRRKYPRPWNQETEKLVAFTFGFVSHQVADVTWHSLGIDQGFLTTMADVNFYGSFSAAHSVGDPGGDMVVSFEGDTKHVPLGFRDWYIPSGDLEDIYFEYYGEKRITKEEIELCTGLLLLAWAGEKIAGAKLFPFFARTSPFLMEDLHSYFQGGIADMAAWSSVLWHDTVDMLEHGTETCFLPHSPLFINCNQSNHAILKTTMGVRKLKNPGTVLLQGVLDGLKPSDLNIKQTARGSLLSLSESLRTKLYQSQNSQLPGYREYMKQRYPQVIRNTHTTDLHTVKIAEYSCSVPYAQLGWSLVYGNFSSGNLSLVIGAPGYGSPGRSQHGRVYLVTSNTEGGLPNTNLDLDSDAYRIIDGSEENGRFGIAMAVIDLNSDGIDDLAVSASSTGSNSLQYTGTVYIFYGISGKGLNPLPSLRIHGNGTFYNLGTSLLGADVDRDGYKDLIIGSHYASVGGPQRGSVAVFLAKTKHKSGSDLSVHSADWLVAGKQDYGWFGYSIIVAYRNRIPVLLISSPTFRLCALKTCNYSKNDNQSVGKVYLFQFTHSNSPQPFATITGSESFMKLGTSLAVGNPYGVGDDENMLAISAATQSIEGREVGIDIPTLFDQSGAIYLIKLSYLFQLGRDVSIDHLKYSALFEGDRSFARFGWSLAFTDVNMDDVKDLLFSAPFRTDDITEELIGAEEGALYVFYGGSSFPSGNATQGKCKEVEPCPGEKASFMVKSSEENSRLGTAFVTLPTPSPSAVNLVISSPHSSSKAFHSGSIHVLRLISK